MEEMTKALAKFFKLSMEHARDHSRPEHTNFILMAREAGLLDTINHRDALGGCAAQQVLTPAGEAALKHK